MLIVAVLLLTIGLWNATLLLSEKGFYGMAFCLSLFAVITIQKNIRDLKNADSHMDKTAFYESLQDNHNAFDEN